jgi:hypothetical protein
MLKRRWRWFGKPVSKEGFEVFFGHKSVYYQDSRGKFEFGYEDGYLSSVPYQVEGQRISLSASDIEQMLDRVIHGIETDGGEVVQVFR